MSNVFGEIDKSSTIIENNVVNYTQNLSSSANGVSTIKIISGSQNTNYWNSLNNLYYTSGSSVYGNEIYFQNTKSNLSYQIAGNKQFLTKYHNYNSSSLISIASTQYGEKIKEGTFQLTDLGNSDSNGNNPVIVDDGNGNLYATNANSNFGTLAASTTSISSSDNFVGNIFYNQGLAIISETGSWSGSVKYSDLANNYKLKFDSFHTITTYEYSINLLPQEYNYSTNYTLRAPLSGSGDYVKYSTPYLNSNFTSSNWQPYITTINLYQQGDYDTPVIQATLPRPVRKSDKINMRFKIKLDI
tara:strand:+ start:166 stop:1068 length:903 start_codon:yes stop_codon:yes gene_type:complete